MRALAERAYFSLCLGAGRLLRSARYSSVELIEQNGERQVRKRRRFHAPLLVLASRPAFALFDTGLRVLAYRGWIDRERRMYELLRRAPIRVDDDAIILPMLPGRTLASLLGDPASSEADCLRAAELAVAALMELHRAGCTHGDAIAENVLVDLAAGTAHWVDFEIAHDARCPFVWRRADDLRALLATALLPTPDDRLDAMLVRIVDSCPDAAVKRQLAEQFRSILRRPLPFHLGQAPLPLSRHRAIGRRLVERMPAVGS